MEYVGSNGSLLFFANERNGAIIDPVLNMVLKTGRADVLSSEQSWSISEYDVDVTDSAVELAEASLSMLDIGVIASSGRKYTIPSGVQSEAKKALEWHKKHHRGGTPVGLNSARILARGGQIGLEKVRHIAKYFPRHEVDKKGKGWSPKEDGFPSNGRIAWALWGGDAGQRWASAIVESENKKAITADGYTLPSYEAIPDAQAYNDQYVGDINDFGRDDVYAPDFIARVRMDGSGIDRLYKIDDDGNVYVWDNGSWDDLGSMHGDIWTRDAELDGEDDTVEKTHVTIDPQSAITIAALLQEDPFRTVSVEDLDDGEEEARMAMDALPEIDWNIVNLAMTAAGDTTKANAEYTPEERAKAAQSQVRNASGQFAKTGARVAVGGDNSKQGTITSTDRATGTVNVKLDNGSTVQVAGRQVDTPRQDVYPTTPAPLPDTYNPLDLSGILGEPRTPLGRPIAQLPGTLPSLTPEDLHNLLADWPSWVSSQRAQFKDYAPTAPVDSRTPSSSTDVGPAGRKLERAAGEKLSVNAYKHPLLKDWLKKQDKASGGNGSIWYNPITSAGDKAVELTPETTDVQPIYMAIVSPDDPRAVMQLSVLVPENSKSTSPMVWTRQQGTWVKDTQTLADLNSATPPPVVPLDETVLNDVLKQVDISQAPEGREKDVKTVAASAYSLDLAIAVLVGEKYDFSALVAAGGLDRNRGNAEELRRYWVSGKGALKIRWGQPGDWKRCVRHLSKYMGVRAKGYCQLRHKEALGIYTSTHAKNDRNASMEEVVYDVYPTEVTNEDMATPLEEICQEVDASYDDAWEPEPHLIGFMEELGACKDHEYQALIAAGGLDRNKGNAEELRRYWTVGKGGLKIRWNTPGDWTRCVRNLKKYLGPRAKGYCALRHKEMDGFWPGDKRNRELSYQEPTGRVYSTDVLKDSDEINTLMVLSARRQDAIDKVNFIAGRTNTDLGYSPETDLLLEDMPLTAAVDGETCPPATQNIELNLKNRQNAIDNVGYGPLNPKEPNDEFWQDKADKWKTTIEEARTTTCATCVFFVRTPQMLDCIATGIEQGGSQQVDADAAITQAELGYCEALDFKCAASRTCNAWAVGGPITAGTVTAGATYQVGDDVNVGVDEFFTKPAYDLPEGIKDYADEAEGDYENEIALSDLVPTQSTVNMRRVEDVLNSDKPIKVWIDEDGEPEIIDGHHRSVARRLSGEMTIKAKVYKSMGLTATAGSKPAPKKDRIKGSDKNKKGSADTGKGVTFTDAIEKALSKKVSDHNEKVDSKRKTSLSTLKAVYRRGAGAFSTSHRPDQNRNSWAMARVNAFLHLLKSGSPKNSKYITDNDLLPASHPKSSKGEASAMVAGGQMTEGARFYIPLVIPEEMESGDGRVFTKGAIELRDLPLPLLWQYKTGDGHDGSVVVGRIDHMERVDGGIGNAHGVFDTGAYGREAERLVRNGFLRGVSADMDRFEAEEDENKEAAAKDNGKKQIKKNRININKARVMAVTIVPKPAFQECKIYMPDNGGELTPEEPIMQDGIYTDEVDPSDAEAIMACGLVASAIPVAPPKDWFTDPKLGKATPLTVDDEGRVFGHIASWSTNHIGLSNGVKPPRSKSRYGYFHTGVCRTAEGADIPVGQLTLAGGHAPLYASAADAVKHYDDTASAVADVHAGEDRFGIWVAGALRPGVQPEQIRTLRASAPSGDWRPIGGALELVAVCQVNVPGFPIARAMVASGQVTALVAAGAATLARMKADPMAELNSRIAKLEKLTLSDKISELTARVKGAEFNYDGQIEVINPATEDLARILDGLLAGVVDLKFRAHGYHWNVEGKDFPQYHELFGEIYEDVDGSIDPLAENVRKLGFPVTFNIAEYASMSDIPAPHLMDSKCQAMAYDLYCANSVILGKYKSAFDVANMANEQGVANFLAERIDMHMKWAWQLRVSTSEYAEEYAESEQDEYLEHNPQQVYEMVFSDLSKNGVLEAVVASVESHDELAESFAAVMEFADFSPLQRKNLAKKGEALPDGSYPIRNEGDLKNAIKAFGRAKASERGDVKKHIIKRARALKKSDLIPETWIKKAMTASADLERMREKLAEFGNLGAVSETDPKKAFSGIATSQLPLELSNEEFEAFASSVDAELKKLVKKTVSGVPISDIKVEEAVKAVTPTVAPPITPSSTPTTTQPAQEQPQAKEVVSDTGKTTVTPDVVVPETGKFVPGKTQPRDVQGRFRLVLARLKQDLGTSGNQDVIAKIAEAENLIGNVGDYAGAVKSASDLINTIDRLDSGALNAKSVENVRVATTELGKTIANLPLPFDNQATKVRFSDLPATLKSLAEDLIKRVEDKIGKKDADVATKELRGFMSGNDVYSQGEVSSQFNRLLRLLT